MKEGVRTTKFIPRVGNWENQAKRQSAALYADSKASTLPRRNTAKAGRPSVSGNTGTQVILVEGERPPLPLGGLADTAEDESVAPLETPKILNAVTTESANVAVRQQSEERHAGTSANLAAVEQRWTGRVTEASEKLAAAVHSVINETAQVEKDFAGCVVDFESLVSDHSNIIHQMEEKLAALGLDESVPSDAAAVADALERTENSPNAGAAVLSSAGAISESWEPGLAHPKLSQTHDAPTRTQDQGVRPPFCVKKVPSKWAAAARRKADRSEGRRGGIE